MTRLETRLDTALPMLVTRADLADIKAEMAGISAETHKSFADVVKWIVGVAFTGMAVVISVMTFLSGRDRQPAPIQTQPIIINVPAPQAAPAPERSQKR